MAEQSEQIGFFRLPQVLEIIPISKSSWWAGCKAKKYPVPVRFGRITCWRKADIFALVEKLNQGEKKN